MREAMGGTGLFIIVLTFLTIFIGFLASVIQFARVYRIKNSIVNYIEEQEGIMDSQEDFELKLAEIGYNTNVRPYLICKYDGGNRGIYYKVKLYVSFSILSASLRVGINGETRLIDTGNYKNSGIWINSNSCVGEDY